MNVKVGALALPRFVCRCKLLPRQPQEEIARVVTPRDAGKLGVLTRQAHPGVQHYRCQKRRLSRREAVGREGSDAILELHRSAF